jgi:hypothetical protein
MNREMEPAPPPTSFEDFTEAGYAALVDTARRRFSFEPFGTGCEGSHVLWRHDVDVSVHRALALARIEAGAGVRSTWLLSLHSAFYNLLEAEVVARARAIFELGHWLGLHFDPSAYSGLDDEAELCRRIEQERALLEDWIGYRVAAVSFHNPDVVELPAMRADRLVGLPNAYAAALETRYDYVSDSNGYWRFRRLDAVLADADVERLHVLTHPEWWPPEAMSPRARLERSAQGRALQVLDANDAALQRYGRLNVR